MLALLLLAAGCGTVLPTPEPVTLRLAAAGSVVPLAEELAAAYGAAYAYVTVDLQVAANSPAAERLVAMGGADAALTTRLPDQAPLANLASSQVMTDTLAVIVHPDNPLRELSLAQLHDLFSGELREWPEGGGPVELAVREPGSGSRAAFDAAVLGEEALTATALIVPGSDAIMEYVAGHPPSIGYVASGWLTDTVRAVTVDGLAPVGEAGYPLALPVYVVTPEVAGPAGADFRAWVLGLVETQDFAALRLAPGW